MRFIIIIVASSARPNKSEDNIAHSPWTAVESVVEKKCRRIRSASAIQLECDYKYCSRAGGELSAAGAAPAPAAEQGAAGALSVCVIPTTTRLSELENIYYNIIIISIIIH